VGVEGGEEGVAAGAVGVLEAVDLGGVVAGRGVLGEDEGREVGRAAAGVEEAAGGEAVDAVRGRRDVADPEAGRDRLREAAEPDDGAGGVERPEGRGRGAVVAELAVRVVLDDDEVVGGGEFDEGLAAVGGEAAAGRVAESRDFVEESWGSLALRSSVTTRPRSSRRMPSLSDAT
jgi:hypothetical protein